jgi:hypothetical protein
LSLDFDHLNEEKILSVIDELISNPKYKQNAENVAKIFQDRTIAPAQAVVYWTEFAARNGGAPHLQSAGRKLSFFQYHSLDVYLLMFSLAFLPCFISYLLLRAIRSKFAAVQSPKKMKKQ